MPSPVLPVRYSPPTPFSYKWSINRSVLGSSSSPLGVSGVMRAGKMRLVVVRSGLGMGRNFRFGILDFGLRWIGGGKRTLHDGPPGESAAGMIAAFFDQKRENKGEHEAGQTCNRISPHDRKIERLLKEAAGKSPDQRDAENLFPIVP